MKELSKFQIILIGIFAAFIVLGVLIFAVGRTSRNAAQVGLVLWGTMPQTKFSEILRDSGLNENQEIKINYEERDPQSFDIDLLEALALDKGPDLFFIQSDSVLKYEDRVLTIPFKNYGEKAFKNSFIEGAEIFLKPEGIIALPVSIDPMVMYWNRDLFNNAQIVAPPKTWDQFYDLATVLTNKESNLNLQKSGVALGEFSNINNAFEILSVLIMQSGNQIIQRQGENFVSLLDQKTSQGVVLSERALSFYTEFSNPLKSYYSWNRSLPWSKNHFIAGDLAIYIGFASELFDIQEKNPNLNFDVASLPQALESARKINYGKIEGIAISKKSQNIGPAFQAVSLLSSPQAATVFSAVNNLPPVRRDLLLQKPERAFMEVFYDEALISRGWLIPDKTQVIQIFKEMIESVSGGRERVSDAVRKANNELRLLFR